MGVRKTNKEKAGNGAVGVGERQGPGDTYAVQPVLAPLEMARQRRAVALKAAEGLWKDRSDVPKDGVQVQEQLRTEWR